MSIQQNINQLLALSNVGAYAYKSYQGKQAANLKDQLQEEKKSLIEDYGEAGEEAARLTEEQYEGAVPLNIKGEKPLQKNYKAALRDLTRERMELYKDWKTKANEQLQTREKHQELLKQLKEKDPGTYAIYGARALEWEKGENK